MGLFDKVKSLFTREQIPDETRLLLSGVDNVQELRRGLDEIITRNEVERKEVERECEKLGKIEEAEKDKIKGGTLTDREKMNTLRYIKRLRRRIESYEKRQKIHEDNIDLHQALMDKIDEMEAMELKAVRQEQIEEIAVDYEERLEKHKEVVAAGRVAQEQDVDYDDVTEKRELAALEKEILGESDVTVLPEEEEEDEDEEPAIEQPRVEKAKEAAKRAPIDEAIAKKQEPAAKEPTESEDEEGDEEAKVLDDRRLELE
jgi:hypothetical protein